MYKWENCAKKLSEKNIKSLIVLDSDYIRYLTELVIHESFDAICILKPNSCSLITDSRYGELAKKLSEKLNLNLVLDPKSKISALVNVLKNEESIGIDTDTFPVGLCRKLETELKNGNFVDLPSWMEKAVEIKNENEIADIKKALEITEHVLMSHAIPLVKEGVSEKDLAAEITYQHKKHGAEKDSFDPIVIAGANSSLPHGMPTDYKIKKGDLLQFDIGCKYNGYCSDLSRIVVLGQPDQKQKSVYETVLAAQKAAMSAVKINGKYWLINEIAKSIIRNNGYGEMMHSIGHGVGIKIHMSPYFNPKDQESMFKNGHIFTIEPGIYIPNWGGIRLENMLAVINNEIQILNHLPENMIII